MRQTGFTISLTRLTKLSIECDFSWVLLPILTVLREQTHTQQIAWRTHRIDAIEENDGVKCSQDF